MSDIQIHATQPTMTVDQRRTRQTPRPDVTFKKVLQGGAQAMLAGAATATRVVGLPTLSAAISRINVDGGAVTSTLPGALGADALQQSTHQQDLSDDMQLLALQDQIQRENRQIALVSNVMKARHETTKSAINNIRS